MLGEGGTPSRATGDQYPCQVRSDAGDLTGAEIGERVRLLRGRSGYSIRQLAKASGVSVAMVSYIERGVHVPGMLTLEKLLAAMDTTFGEFFSDGARPDGPVMRREQMKVISDPERTYAVALPALRSPNLELTDERIRAAVERPAFATLSRDLVGYVISGNLMLEIEGQKPIDVRAGDAFRIPAGTSHRGYVTDGETRLISVATLRESGHVD